MSALLVLPVMAITPSGEAQQPSQQYAAADVLKQQAIGALRSGDFDETQKLIEQARKLRPEDTRLRQIDEWISNFQSRRTEFLAERQKLFERQVEEVRLLQENGYRSYAITAASAAQQLAPEKDTFRREGWVRELIRESAELGRQYEQKGEWLRAMRVWGDLASIEELNPLWKEHLRGSTRRVRLLAIYTPEILEELRDSTQVERDAVDVLLTEHRKARRQAAGEAPIEDQPLDEGEESTPETRAEARDASDEMDDSFRTDWRDAVRGITRTMLRDALVDAQQYYVQPVEYRDMLVGGFDAAIALATTPGMERAFPTMADENARQQYVTNLKRLRDNLAATEPARIDRARLTEILNSLRTINDQTVKIQEEVLVSEFADGALSALDPFTGMIWPSQLAEFTKGTQGEFVGVGIQIRSEDNGDLRVVSPLPDSPAYEAGIQPNDVITHIDGRSARGISDTQAVTFITGRPGTAVTLTIRSSDGTVKDYKLDRRRINVISVKGWKQLPGGKWDYFVDSENRIAYLRLTNFQKTTSEELATAIRQLQREGARGVILDLRYNPGGLLQSAVEVADQFLSGGLIVSTRAERAVDVTPQAVHHARNQRTDVNLPLVVLVNQYSASASEIVGGALKDHHRALVVGERTFGKGSVQMLYGIGGNTAVLKLTTAHYYLPSGRNIHKEDFATDWGVDPDVQVEMTFEQMRDAISARQSLDVLREDGSRAEVKIRDELLDAEEALLETDSQLSAALLLLRIELAGERLTGA